MKHLRNTLGFLIAGVLVMSIWDGYVNPYGIAGGYAGAIIIIGPLWYLNHKLGLIHQDPDVAFVDMALGIGIAGLARDYFLAQDFSVIVDAVPTLLYVILGGVIGGVVAAYIERDMEIDKKKANRGEQE